MKIWPPVLVVVALLVAGCVDETTEPDGAQVASAVETLRTEDVGFGSLTVTPEQISAFVVRDGATRHWVLAPEELAEEEVDFRVAEFPVASLDPAAVQEQVASLAETCADGYQVQVEALSEHAVSSYVSCDGSTEEDTRRGFLNGEPLPEFDGLWSAEQWQELLDEIAVVAPSGRVERLEIVPSSGAIGIRLTEVDATHTCNPELIRSIDGSELSLVCWETPGSQPHVLLDGLTGTDFASAALEAADEGDVVIDENTEYRLTLQQSNPQLTVSDGRHRGSAVVGI